MEKKLLNIKFTNTFSFKKKPNPNYTSKIIIIIIFIYTNDHKSYDYSREIFRNETNFCRTPPEFSEQTHYNISAISPQMLPNYDSEDKKIHIKTSKLVGNNFLFSLFGRHLKTETVTIQQLSL